MSYVALHKPAMRLVQDVSISLSDTYSKLMIMCRYGQR